MQSNDRQSRGVQLETLEHLSITPFKFLSMLEHEMKQEREAATGRCFVQCIANDREKLRAAAVERASAIEVATSPQMPLTSTLLVEHIT